MNKSTISQIKKVTSRDLPGLRAHEEMSPLKRLSGQFPDKENARLSAVAVVLTEMDNILSILLIQRHEYEGAHSGQISFPGGKKEEHDPDLEYTARRECFEEIGLILKESSLICKLTEVYIPVSKFMVHPYLYFQAQNEPLIIQEREVREVIHFPLHELCSDQSKSTMNVRSKDGLLYRNIPCFRTGDKEIWGATAIILNELRMVLLEQNKSWKMP